jgi:alkanesulfonate monooxygenase SsuD/methylene tetrahydromethanopterin reductase-like flavin-dependent oxidoreductase (luciferase family)
MANKLSFGYLYDFRNPPQWHRPWAELYAEILDFIAWSEGVGFDGAWVPEHHDAEDGYVPAPLTVLAAIAARTNRMKIGSGVALARVAKYADGYFGNEEFCGLYADKLRDAGKDPAAARVRIQGLFTIVAHDPTAAMEELAPYFHHVNNSYGVWMNEDKAVGIDSPGLKPRSRERFKTSGILQIMTPGQAIDHFRAMQARIPVEHYVLMLPPGIATERFKPYAELFAKEVIPAFL